MGQLAPKLLVRTSNDIELLQKTILSTSSRGDSIAPPVIEAEPPLELHCPLKSDTQLVAHVPIAPIAAPLPPAQFIILDWPQSVDCVGACTPASIGVRPAMRSPRAVFFYYRADSDRCVSPKVRCGPFSEGTPVGRFNEPLHFVALQPVCGSIARAGRSSPLSDLTSERGKCCGCHAQRIRGELFLSPNKVKRARHPHGPSVSVGRRELPATNE